MFPLTVVHLGALDFEARHSLALQKEATATAPQPWLGWIPQQEARIGKYLELEVDVGSWAWLFPGHRAGLGVMLEDRGAVPRATALAYVTALAQLLAPPPTGSARGGATRGRDRGLLDARTFRDRGCGEQGNGWTAGVRAASLPSRSLIPWQRALGAVWGVRRFLRPHFVPAPSSGERVLRRPGSPGRGRPGGGLATPLGGGWTHLLASHSLQHHPHRRW